MSALDEFPSSSIHVRMLCPARVLFRGDETALLLDTMGSSNAIRTIYPEGPSL